MNQLLMGAYDLHVHTAPDAVERKCTDFELAHRCQAAGMAGIAIKSHWFETAARAKLLQLQFPKLKVAGGIALNRSVGGINPFAVEKAAQIGGQFVWMPTMDAKSYQQFLNAGKEPNCAASYLALLDENGSLHKAVYEVLEVAAKYDLTVCTGHVSAAEGIAMIRAAAGCGVRRLIVTHADNPADSYTTEQQKICIRYGSFIEHCYFTTHRGRIPAEEICRQIQSVGCRHVLLSTDFGQTDSPYPEEGLSEYLNILGKHGIRDADLETMVKKNPSYLMQSFP